MFKQITIVGMGLIGSSLARAVKKHNLCKKLIATDKSLKVCDEIRELGLADTVVADVTKAVMGSDLLILAVPVGAYESVASKIGPLLKPGAILTDVGSVKKNPIESMRPFIPDSVHIVPAHPIAGGHQSGPKEGFAELFQERWCILTPLPDTDIKAVEVTTKFWEACGSRVEIMEPDRHDLVLGITSHLPHLIAYSIVHTADELEEDTKAEVIKYSAGGFRDFTRIAASDPTMWRDVFLNNKEAVLEILQRFTEDLTALQKAIRRGDGTYLHEVFSHTREIRRKVIELGPLGLNVPIEKLQE